MFNHLFRGREGAIEAEAMEQAIANIQWHLEETRRLLAPFPQETNYEDAEKLMKWILSKRAT